MLRLTLRTLLAYLDDTLPPADSRQMGLKVNENPTAQELVARIRRVTRRRGLSTPPAGPDGGPSDPNTVAEYLSDVLTDDRLTEFEQACLEHDVHLAEVAATHQILTMVLSEPVRVPPTARKRMYQLVKGRESLPDRKPNGAHPARGVGEDDHPADAGDDADVSLLLGLASHPKHDSRKRTMAFAGTAAGLAAAFLFAAWMALPASPGISHPAAPTAELAQAPPTPQPPVPQPTDTSPQLEDAKEPAPKADAQPDPELAPPPKPKDEPPAPAPKVEPKKEPADELVTAVAPPKADKVTVGQLERPAGVVVLAKSADGESWTRIAAADAAVSSARTVLSLPGYRSGVKLETGVQVDLWGNVPDLFPSPLLASEATFHAPPDGFDADVTVHAGRVYLTAMKPAGGKVRLRFADQVWDVTLPDEKSDVAFEVVRAMARGTGSEPARVEAVLAVLAGTVGLKVRYKDMPKIEAGEIATWDNKGKGLEGPRKPDPKAGTKPSVYFSRFPLVAESDQHRRMNAALGELSQRLTDPDRVLVVLAEMLQDRADASADAAGRVGVFAEAAIRHWPGLVDAISDAGRSSVREAAAVGLQAALAADPDGAKEVRRLLMERYRLTGEDADTALRLLRGFTDAEKKRPETIDRLVEALASPAVAVRELAIMNLLTDVDPESAGNNGLSRFDAGGPEENRETAVRAWKRRADEVKKKLEMMP